MQSYTAGRRQSQNLGQGLLGQGLSDLRLCAQGNPFTKYDGEQEVASPRGTTGCEDSPPLGEIPLRPCQGRPLPIPSPRSVPTVDGPFPGSCRVFFNRPHHQDRGCLQGLPGAQAEGIHRPKSLDQHKKQLIPSEWDGRTEGRRYQSSPTAGLCMCVGGGGGGMFWG